MTESIGSFEKPEKPGPVEAKCPLGPPTPEQRVDQIMASIRREIGMRSDERCPVAVPSTGRVESPAVNPQLPRRRSSIQGPDPAKQEYHVNEFLGLDLQTFLNSAFRVILGREADPESRVFFEHGLRSGAMTPIDVLGHLEASPEGQLHGVEIRGLRSRFIFSRLTRKLPVLGYFFRWAVDLSRLPSRVTALRHENLLLRDQLATLDRRVDELTESIEASLGRIAERVAVVDLPSLESKLETLSFSKAEATAVDHLTREVAKIYRLSQRVSWLETRLPTGLETVPHQDDLYWSLEKVFRGTREDIKSRQTPYLKYVRSCSVRLEEYPILDLGCGRGEWLEVLRDAGYPARGVERNRLMVEHCRSKTLEVEERDILEYLSVLESESVGFVTVFHVVEHLEHEQLLFLLKQVRRVLRSGGMLLIETPNPENLLVGSCRFYLDPTHKKPIPPDLLRFLVGRYGFIDLEVLPLHPCSSRERLQDGGQNERLNDVLYGPQDYAVVGHKP